jgi:hypothetical protein
MYLGNTCRKPWAENSRKGEKMTKRIWFFTGGKGCGKSTAACRFARPSEIDKMVVFDTEDSLSDILADNKRMGVKFGAYIRAYDRFKPDDDMLDLIARGKLPWVTGGQKSVLVDYWEWFVQVLNDTIDPERHRYIALDTIEPIEAAATAWAEVNRDLSGWSGKRSYGGLEIEAVRPLLENTFEAIHQRGITDFFLTSHTKNPWVEYAPGKSRPVLDKVKPGGRLKIWSMMSTAMFWLQRPARPLNQDGAPSAIVLKARIGESSIDKKADEWDTKSLIPPRIPRFTWRDWRWYLKNGWNPLDPREGELLSPDEDRIISELLSNQEYELMILGAKIALEEEQRGQSVGVLASAPRNNPDPFEHTVKEMVADGKTELEIREATGKPLPVVKAVIKRFREVDDE